jgi:PPP family 3-phenylpropionic acid transporter
MARAARLRFSIAQAAPSAVGGFYLPFFPVWLAAQGLAPAEISAAMAASMLARVLVGPTAGIVADALGDRRAVAVVCALMAACGFALMAFLGPDHGLAAILPLMLFAVPLNSATGPIVEAVTARGALDYRFDYARVRLWGSIAFIASNAAAGTVVGMTGPHWIAWIISGLLIVCAIAYVPMPRLLTDRRAAPRPWRRALARTMHEARVLLRQPTFLLFLAAVTAAQTAHAVMYAFGTLTFQSFGYSDPFIGVLWASGVVAEVVLFAFAGRLVRGWRATTLIGLGVSLGALRWVGMAFDTGPVALLGLQVLHAGSFALVHLGTMRFLSIAVPARLTATGQSLFAVVAYGLGMGTMTFVSGLIYDSAGARTYLLMAGLSLLSFGLTLMLARAWNGRSLFAFRNRMGVM